MGEFSPIFALTEMLIETHDDEVVARAVDEAVARHADDEPAPKPLLRLKRRLDERRALCAVAARVLREEAAPTRSPDPTLPSVRAVFTKLLADDEEPSVALPSLEPPMRADAIEELVAWLEGYGLLKPTARVLDFGCDGGEITAAIAPRVQHIDAVETSARRAERTGARCAGTYNVRVHHVTDPSLPPIEDRSVQLVLAVDILPHVVRVGRDLLGASMSAFARVLPKGGHLAIFNFNYGQSLVAQRAQLLELAQLYGFQLKTALQPFTAWSGAAFLLRRDGSLGIDGRGKGPRTAT
ncbi:MAG: class I SAM-dependent methyltransferase [Polyangiales bacterium]